MKRKIISTLLAITTIYGCGDSGSSSNLEVETLPEPIEIVYTDPQEIKDKFIVNEGTGEVYVGGALTQDPNTEIASALRNNEFQTSFTTLRALEDITNIYVTHANITKENYIVVNSIRAMGDIINLYDRPASVFIDNGYYEGDASLVLLHNPTQIEGNGKNNTTLATLIMGLEYLGVKDLTSVGEIVDAFGSVWAGSFAFYNSGEFYDSELTGVSAIGVNTLTPFTMSNVQFRDINNPIFNVGFYFNENEDVSNIVDNPIVKISYTTFQDLPIAIEIHSRTDIGDVENANGGYNTFRDVGTGIYYRLGSTEDSFAEGNYWAESFPEESLE